ncbi:MAG TPA: DinB family protein [Gemmatimonadaceae bacterium]|jgi:uncharacterized damage-inducible protein DinB
MSSTHLTLFDHVAWADTQARAAIDTLPAGSPERTQAVRLYSHIAAAEHVWLARLEGRTPAHAIWPDLTLDAAAALAAESAAGLRAMAAHGPDALMQEVEYRNSTGKAFRNTVADVLTHVALHGSYHRGQIALLTRQGGGAPAITDYIAFVRDAVGEPSRQ